MIYKYYGTPGTGKTYKLISRAKAVGIQREAVHGATAPNGAKVAALRSLFLHARLYSSSVRVAIPFANTDCDSSDTKDLEEDVCTMGGLHHYPGCQD